jgi:HlyD family secretion protein
MKLKTWIYAGTAALLLVLAGGWAFAPRPLPVEMANVSIGRFETSIDEDGKTRLLERYVVSASLSGRLSRITWREGDEVLANAALAQLTPALPALLDDRTQRELQARLEAAQARMQQATTRIERAQVAQTMAQNDSKRSEQLAQQGFIATTKLEADRLGSLGAQKEVAASVEERHVAQHDVEQARAALGMVRAGTVASKPAMAAFVVRSPVAGQVLRLLQASEANVLVGTPLMEIGDTRRLEIVTDLLTTDAPSAQPGSPVTIERWGGALPLQGRVVRIEPAGFTKVSALGVEEQRVRAIIAITSPPEQWRALGDGYRVSVRILTLTQEQALQVPVSAVFPLPASSDSNAGDKGGSDKSGSNNKAEPQFAVFTVQDGRARQVPVALGARNGSMAWVKAGLKANDQVIVYPASQVQEGVRVMARPS